MKQPMKQSRRAVMAVCLAASVSSAVSAATPVAGKDVVVDAAAPAAAPAASTPGGRLVPSPARPPRGASVVAATPIYTTPIHDAAVAAALGDLGLALMQQQSRLSGRAEVNAVVSPLSVASAMGMVHAGAAGETARELATLLASGPAANQGFVSRLPSVLSRLSAKANGEAGPLVSANRVWVRKDVASAVPGPFAAMLKARFAADAAVLSFDNAEAARRAINQWTSDQTRRMVPTLLPQGSVTPSTKLLVTNAVHFKSRWAVPFDPKDTEPKPFQTAQGAKLVPTMSDERPVLQGTIDNLTVYELPFSGKTFALMVAMAPKGHTLNALENDLAGLDIAAWSAQLKESTCRFEMPKFAIDAQAHSLKPALQALGVRTVFTDQADLQPMLGKAAAGTSVDEVFHAATIVVDEQGGEAAAATAATIQAKSFQPPAAMCAVDRPFIFAVVHKPTGAPVFVGKVADPVASRL